MGQWGQTFDDDNYVTNEDLPFNAGRVRFDTLALFYFSAAALTVSQDGDII